MDDEQVPQAPALAADDRDREPPGYPPLTEITGSGSFSLAPVGRVRDGD